MTHIADIEGAITAPTSERLNRHAVERVQQCLERQEELVAALRQVCRRFGIKPTRAARAAHALLGSEYLPTICLPLVAPVTWKGRPLEDRQLNPMMFLEKHWGEYLDTDVLSQVDLRRLDMSLFNAIQIYCKNRHIDPKDYLPPPSRTRVVPVSAPATAVSPPRQERQPAGHRVERTLEHV